MKKTIRVAQLQTRVLENKLETIDALEPQMQRAAQQGAELVCLPEMFCCPYRSENFPLYAEPEGGPTYLALQELAIRFGVCLSAGSVPELGEDGRIYNTAYVFDRRGSQIAKHRKVHLFDVDIQGGVRFFESQTLSAGNHATVFDTEFGVMGLCICYDVRFPELSRQMVDAGAAVILVPAAFNRTTGPAHWELLFRARAADNQAFYVGTSPALDLHSCYHAWGHSIVTGPWGNVQGQLGDEPGMQMTELNLDEVRRVRQELPLLQHRRPEVYQTPPKS